MAPDNGGATGAIGARETMGGAVGLRSNTLNQIETLGQSIANIAPTLTPALNISVVAGLAGVGSWVSYLIGTVGMMFVAGSIATLARRHPLSGSYFVYIGRTFGPLAGALGGWAMVEAYLFTAVASLIALTVFLQNLLTTLGLEAVLPPRAAIMLVFGALIWVAGYRDIRLSSRLGLLLEGLSVTLLIVIMAVIVIDHGTIIDKVQLDFAHLDLSGITASLAFAAFSFVGFESAATLAKESRDPARTIPRAITGSAAVVGLFFTLTAYCMVMGMGDDAKAIGDSASPLTDVTARVGIGWAAAIVYISATVSAFACSLACVTAASRILFSMARYRVIGAGMGAVHRTHQTPHAAITLCCVLVVAACLATLPLSPLDAFGYTGTFATFGFLIVYLMISLVAPLDMRRSGTLRPSHVLVGAVGALMMAFVIFGTLYPMPAYPYNLLPYLFAGYMLIGAAWFGYLQRRRPEALGLIEHDLES